MKWDIWDIGDGWLAGNCCICRRRITVVGPRTQQSRSAASGASLGAQGGSRLDFARKSAEIRVWDADTRFFRFGQIWDFRVWGLGPSQKSVQCQKLINFI